MTSKTDKKTIADLLEFEVAANKTIQTLEAEIAARNKYVAELEAMLRTDRREDRDA